MARTDAVVTLHRYYVWANRMRTHFDTLLEGVSTAKDKKNSFEIEARLYMSYWYSALYVVIEGWRDLKLNDPVIDSLLRSKNVPLLKRYRNGTFHYQKNYNDERFFELIDKGESVVEWIRSLNSEFGRWFLSTVRQQ